MSTHSGSFKKWLAGRKANAKELSAYISTLDEWWNAEFKAATQDGDYVLRKAVCALSNSGGAELFVGVADDKTLVGTGLTEQRIGQILEQKGATPGDWYIVNMMSSVRNIVQVAIDEPGGSSDKWVYVLEVSYPGRPVFLQDENDVLNLYLREGDSSKLANSFKALQWSRNMTREEILRTCYLELRTLSKVVGEKYVGIALSLGLTLPYLQRRLEDGSFYRSLTDEDLMFILGEVQGSGRKGGILWEVFEARHEVEKALKVSEHEFRANLDVWERLRQANERLAQNADSMKAYLERQGIPVD